VIAAASEIRGAILVIREARDNAKKAGRHDEAGGLLFALDCLERARREIEHGPSAVQVAR